MSGELHRMGNDGILAVSGKEAARRLGVCERTIWNLVRAKELASRKIGRRRVIPVAALESFLRRDHEIIGKPARRADESVCEAAA